MIGSDSRGRRHVADQLGRARARLATGVVALGVWCGALQALASRASASEEPAPGATQDASQRARARELGERGLGAYDAGDYSSASELFGQAVALYDFPTLRLFLARSLAKRDRPVAASRQYQLLLARPVQPDEGEVGAQARASAREELPAVEARRARLTVSLWGGSPQLRLEVSTPSSRERQSVPLDRESFVEPGSYEVRVSHPDGRAIARSIELAPGEAERVDLDWSQATAVSGAPGVESTSPDHDAASRSAAPQPSEAPGDSASSNTPAWIAGTLTGALVAGVIVTGLMAADRKDRYDAQNRNRAVDRDTKRDLYDQAFRLQALNTALSAAALLAGGVTVYFVVRTPDPPASHDPNARAGRSVEGATFGVFGSF